MTTSLPRTALDELARVQAEMDEELRASEALRSGWASTGAGWSYAGLGTGTGVQTGTTAATWHNSATGSGSIMLGVGIGAGTPTATRPRWSSDMLPLLPPLPQIIPAVHAARRDEPIPEYPTGFKEFIQRTPNA